MHVCTIWVHVYGAVGCKVCGCWLQSMRLLGASIWKLLDACMWMSGVCLWSGWVQSMRLFGAKYADVGCIYAETLGCKYAVVGCKSMEGLGAFLTVGRFA